MLSLTAPRRTALHRLPAGVKLAALALTTVALFGMDQPLALAAALVAIAAVILALGRDFAGASVRLLWPLWPFVAVIVVWHGWQGDWESGAVVLLRMTAAVAAANLVTMTTPLSAMLAVFEHLCRPLARVGLPPRAPALAAALVIRFIPELAARLAQIREGWRARSPRRPGWRILVPATLAALDDADRVAEALRARGGF